MDQSVKLDHPENLVSLDQKVLPVVTEAPDLRVLWAHLDLAVLLENLVKQVLLVPLVQLVLQVLLVNRWAMTLPPLPLFSDKANQRYIKMSF